MERHPELSDRDEQIIRAYVVRRRTLAEVGQEFDLSVTRVHQIIQNYRASLKPIDHEQIRREMLEVYFDTLRRAGELDLLEGAPVTSGKDGEVVRDPESGAVVRDYSGRLAAHQVRMRATEHIRKMLGLDAAEKVETTQHVKYELIGINTEDLT